MKVTMAMLTGLALVPLILNAGEARVYQFGVFPYQPSERMRQAWSPLAQQMEAVLGRKVTLRTRTNFESFHNDFTAGQFDIAFVQPFTYVRAAADNYLPVARVYDEDNTRREGRFRALFVVLENSKVKTIHELAGSTLALPPREAAVSILALSHLQQAGVIMNKDIKLANFLNHSSCLRQLVIRKARSCVTATPPYRNFQKKTGARLRILASTQSIPSSLVVVHKRVAVSERRALRALLIGLSSTGAGKHFLQQAGFGGFIGTKDEDYDSVRHIWKDVGD